MEKVQTKIKKRGFFTLFATLALALGVGVSLAPKEVLRTAAASTYTWTAASGDETKFSATSKTSAFGEMTWEVKQAKANHNGFTEGSIQIGKNGGSNGVVSMTGTLPAKFGAEIESISVATASYNGSSKLTIKVGGVTVKASTATSNWTTVSSISTGAIAQGVNGVIELSWTASSRALYLKSITIVGRDASGPVEPDPDFDVLSSIAIKTPATKLSFNVGETFSSAGLVLTASDNSSPVITKDVPSGYSTNLDGVKFLESHLGTQDVVVSYEEGGVTKTVNYEIQVNEEPVFKTYTKITSIDDLHIGANYVITSGSTYVMTTTQNGNNRASETITLTGGKIVEKENTQRIQLTTGTKANTFGLRAINGSFQGYLAAASSSSNYLHTLETLTDNASWAITFGGSTLSVKAQGTNTRNDLKFNSTNTPPIFSAYASGQDAISMWIDETSISTEPSVLITANAPEVIEGSTLQLSALTANTGGAAVAWSVDDSTVATINSTSGLLSAIKPGSVTVTATLVVGGVTYTDEVEVTVTTNPYDHAGTEADPFSVKDALLKASETGTTETTQEYYVRGIISSLGEIDTTKYYNATFDIKDSLSDTVSFTAYRVKWGPTGANFTTELAKNIAIGYEVLLVGKIVNYNYNTPELVQNSKLLSVDKTAAIYAEAKVFADWIMAKDGGDAEGMTSPSTCEDNFLEAWLMWDDLSQDAKDLFKTHADFASAKARLTNWALANDLMSLDEMDNESSGTKGALQSNVNSITLTVLIGVVGLTALTGYYFLKRKKAERN